MSGPDYIFPADNFTTSIIDGYTKIQTTNENPANIQPKSLITLVKEQCEEAGSTLTAFQVNRGGKWISWTFQDYYRDIKCVARAFIKLGLEERQTVCVQGFNSPEWFLSCQGAIQAGGIVSNKFKCI